MEDAKIIDLYFARSEEAISETDKKYGAYCRKISNNILADVRDVEESVSDAYMHAWESIPPERPKIFSAWLARVVRNISINKLNHNTAEKRGGGQTGAVLSELEECLPSPCGIDTAIESALITSAVEKFLRSLTPEKRVMFVRRYWYLDPLKDIAAGAGISEKYAASLLFRMRRSLKEFLEKEGITI